MHTGVEERAACSYRRKCFGRWDSGDGIRDHRAQPGHIITSYGEPARNFHFNNNIVQYNLYGIACSIGKPCPDLAFCNCFPGATMQGNVIADNENVSAAYPIDKAFPPGNYIVRSYNELGFVDHAHGNWQLGPRSAYRGKGTDGKDPGIDFGLFNASGVRSAKEGKAMK